MVKRKTAGRPSERLFADAQADMFEKSYEERIREEENQPVECLGMTFPNDEQRRKHFLTILREKLKDPEFRKIEGFPIGADEDILALSDPPYYTACPNPFMADFVNHYGKPYDPKTDNYRREPFAADTGAGKTHPLYTAHSYHSKIPHLAIMPCILHYAEPDAIVFDGFSGSGMTGIAAQLCGQPEAGFKAALETEWKDVGRDAPRWGARVPVMMDLSPVANFIAYNLNMDVPVADFEKAAKQLFRQLEQELGRMYETLHTDGKSLGRINYTVWSEVLTCSNCAGDVVFMDQAYDPATRKFIEDFECSHCGATLSTRSCKHKLTTHFDKATGQTIRRITYVPIEIEYTIPGKKTKHRKKPDQRDLAILENLRDEAPSDHFPSQPIPKDIYHYSRLAPKGVTHFHLLYLRRALHALSAMWRMAGEWQEVRTRGFLKFMVEEIAA